MSAHPGELAARRELARVAERHRVDAAAHARLWTLSRLIASDPRAPTTVTELPAVIRDHLADSLVALELPEVAAADRLIDLGAGAGFPGLPIAILRSSVEVVLLEAARRKVDFLESAISRLGLANAAAVHGRAESWPGGPSGNHEAGVVMARALGPLPVVVELAAPLLDLGGSLIVWRGRRVSEHERQGEAAADHVGLEPVRVVAVQPYASAEHRHLHVYRKVAITPQRFPRRPGMAAKRPLAGPGSRP